MCQVPCQGTEDLTVEHADMISTHTEFIIQWEMQTSKPGYSAVMEKYW